MTASALLADAVVVDHCIQTETAVLVDDGLVTGLVPATEIPASHPIRRLPGTLLPGAIDLQLNGIAGQGCESTNPAAFGAIAAAAAQGGAAGFLATLITGALADVCERAARWASWIDHVQPDPSIALPLGIHLEGPFLEVSGTHDDSLFVDPTPERVDQLIEACAGHLRLVTLAPGRPGAAEAVRRFRQAGAAVAFGHASTTDGFAECVDAGATLVTHLYNAMSGLHHRDPGIVGLALDEPRLTCTLIPDGHHVSGPALRIARRALGRDRFAVVTDAMAAAGMPDGNYEICGIPVTLRDGVVRNQQGALAGSALTSAGTVEGLLRLMPELDAVDVAAATAGNPARVLGIEDRLGAIQVGAVARFGVLRDGTYEALLLA